MLIENYTNTSLYEKVITSLVILLYSVFHKTVKSDLPISALRDSHWYNSVFVRWHGLVGINWGVSRTGEVGCYWNPPKTDFNRRRVTEKPKETGQSFSPVILPTVIMVQACMSR